MGGFLQHKSRRFLLIMLTALFFCCHINTAALSDEKIDSKDSDSLNNTEKQKLLFSEHCPYQWRVVPDDELKVILKKHANWLKQDHLSLIDIYGDRYGAIISEKFFNLLQRFGIDRRNFDKYNLQDGPQSQETEAQEKSDEELAERANLCRAILRGKNLDGALLKRANLRNAILVKAVLNNANLAGADLDYVHLEDAELNNTNLSGASLKHAILISAKAQNSDFSNAILESAILDNAVLLKTRLENASLIRAKFTEADLRGASLQYSDILESNFEKARLHDANFVGVELQKNSIFKDLAPENFPDGLVSVREKFKSAGDRDEERYLTFLIRSNETKSASWPEKYFNFIFFEYPSDYGYSPGKPLVLLGCLVLFFAAIYYIAIVLQSISANATRIYQVWPEGRIDVSKLTGGKGELADKSKVNPLAPEYRLLSGIWYAFYFSLISAFHIGWRDLNVGNWLNRLQPQEYIMRPTGWVRVVSGAQSLISVYLLALWVLVYFGRPFE